MIDAILRAAEVMMMLRSVPMRTDLELYADDGRLGGRPELLQSYLDKSWNTLRSGGPEVNAIKTVSMTSRPNFRWPAHKIGEHTTAD
jgi:hypothetical protein